MCDVLRNVCTYNPIHLLQFVAIKTQCTSKDIYCSPTKKPHLLSESDILCKKCCLFVCLIWNKASIIIKLPIQVFQLCTYHCLNSPMESLICTSLSDQEMYFGILQYSVVKLCGSFSNFIILFHSTVEMSDFQFPRCSNVVALDPMSSFTISLSFAAI